MRPVDGRRFEQVVWRLGVGRRPGGRHVARVVVAERRHAVGRQPLRGGIIRVVDAVLPAAVAAGARSQRDASRFASAP